MKHLILLVALLSTAFLSCKNDDDTSPIVEEPRGVASSFVNGNLWEGDPFFKNLVDSLYRIHMYTFSPEGFVRNHLFLRSFPLSLEKMPLSKYDTWNPFIKPSASFRTLLADGDVLGTSYEVIENDTIEDFIQLTEINLETMEVSGEFQVSMVLKDTIRRIFATYPDTVVFRDGFFKAKILE